DTGLEYFRGWRDAFGIAGLPVVYGFIPATLNDRELIWLRENLSGGEELAVHGWDHARGTSVTAEQMQTARRLFGAAGLCRSYIPPFNAYSEWTVRDWADACPDGYFFGGFPGDLQSVNYGPLPAACGHVLHLPACQLLYERAGQLLPVLD